MIFRRFLPTLVAAALGACTGSPSGTAGTTTSAAASVTSTNGSATGASTAGASTTGGVTGISTSGTAATGSTGSTSSSGGGGSSSGVAAACALLDGGLGDATAVAAATAPYTAIEQALKPDSNGYLGQNHTYGMMISARFQEGAGLGVRIAVLVADQTRATNDLHAIEVGAASINQTTGEVPITLPPGWDGGTPSSGDAADAASFFLGDACLGVIALAKAPAAWNLATRASALLSPLHLATEWLRQPQTLQALTTQDATAPNRLMFAARAFEACGVLNSDATEIAAALPLIGAAEALQNDAGVFEENGGSDTNYQSFSVRNGYDLLTVADSDRCSDLFPRVLSGAEWLAGRVRPDGTVDSADNTRTCGGGESFFGAQKGMSVPGVFEALAGPGAVDDDTFLLDAGMREANHYIADPSGTTCLCGPSETVCGP